MANKPPPQALSLPTIADVPDSCLLQPQPKPKIAEPMNADKATNVAAVPNSQQGRSVEEYEENG